MLSVGQIIEANHIQCPNRRFKLIKHLGEGAEGQVYLTEPQNWIENQYPQLALKFQSKQHDVTFIQNLKIYQQQNESKAFAIPSGMIKILDNFEWNKYQVIAMEAGSITLFQYIYSNYTEQEAFQILQQLSYSVKFLHFNNLFHRDLKPENYIKVGDKFKLIDFGLVKQSQRLATPNVGSPLFQAPEIVINQQYSTPVDIWSLGCVFFEVMTKQPLCFAQSDQELLNLLKNHINNPNHLYGRIDQFIKNQVLQKLMKEMIHPEPSKRATIDDVQNQLKILIFPNFNPNIIIQPKPQIDINQESLELKKSIKEMTTQINQLKEIQQTQNNDLELQMQSLFKNFEEKIENKIDQKMLQIYGLKEDANLNFKQFSKSFEQLELNLFQKINDQFNSFQQNSYNQQKIQNDEFLNYQEKNFQVMSNQLEERLIKNNEEKLQLQNNQFQGSIQCVNQLIKEQKNTSVQIMKQFDENLNNLIKLKDQIYEQVRVNQAYSSKFEEQQIKQQNLIQQIIEIASDKKDYLEQEKLQNLANSQSLQQFQKIQQQLEQIQALSSKSFKHLKEFQPKCLQENKINQKQEKKKLDIINFKKEQNLENNFMFCKSRQAPLSKQKQEASEKESKNQNQFYGVHELGQLSANNEQQDDLETRSIQNFTNKDNSCNQQIQNQNQCQKLIKNQLDKRQQTFLLQQSIPNNKRPNSAPQKPNLQKKQTKFTNKQHEESMKQTQQIKES